MLKYLVTYIVVSGEFEYRDFFILNSTGIDTAYKRAEKIADEENESDEPMLLHDSFLEQMKIKGVVYVPPSDLETLDRYRIAIELE